MQEIAITFKTGTTYSSDEILDLTDSLKEMVLDIDDAIDPGTVVIKVGDNEVDAESLTRSWMAEQDVIDNIKLAIEIHENGL